MSLEPLFVLAPKSFLRLPGRFPFRKVPFLLFPDSVVNDLSVRVLRPAVCWWR
ncbi:hypothetical protein LFML04_1442 [Leptospirillum ferriphilum ML-04]|uniref:Uncharacterized protein n=1 Tax=Leptospirillum ferriphilum (strain ML-04) TaxID=1048260 RepID=J9ZCJ7_LEPFM|nr:hypothetical protein LFML04_1367 [Leptospirillum ferriphilum ML-04]AFS53656.1 hypothetical protein LFML04_1442 [Leptospirillum ferriphilum ML-04]